MVDLEVELLDLAAHVDWPAGDDLAHAVGARLRSPEATGVVMPLRPRRLSWRVATAVAAVAALAVVAAVPSSRSAVAGWLGVRGERIVVSPTTVPTALAPAALDLGPAVRLSDVPAAVGFPMLVPRVEGFDRPDEVHVAHPPVTGEAALVYRARAGLPAAGPTGVGMLITAFRADLEPGLFGKVLGPGARMENVVVTGGPAYWIEGAPHQFFYRDASGDIHPETIRLAGNVLLWERNGITLRIESALPRDDVVRIADSMR